MDIEIFYLLIVIALYIQSLILVFFLGSKKGGSIGVFLAWITTPILQLLIGFVVLYCFDSIIHGDMAYAAGAVIAIVGIAGSISILSGFLLVPVMLRYYGGYKKYFIAPCPKCRYDVYWGDLHCKKCLHHFSDNEIEILKVALNDNKKE